MPFPADAGRHGQPPPAAESPPDAPPDLPEPPEDALRAAQGRLIFTRSRLTNLLGLPLVLLVCALLWPERSPALLLAWAAAKLVTCVWRARLDRLHREADDALVALRLRQHLWPLAADGLVYSGLGGWLLAQPHSPQASLALATTVAIAGVGFVLLVPHLRSLLAFLLPLMVPGIVWQAAQGDRMGLFAAGAGSLMLLVLVVEGQRAERLIRQATRTRLQLHALAEQRRNALALAHQHARVKDRFLATMSHEMRTPLHAMLGMARLLNHGLLSLQGQVATPPPAAEQAWPAPPAGPSPQALLRQAGEQLRLLERHGEQLLTLISDLLDFSRLDAGELPLQPQDFDLAQLLDDVVRQLRQACHDKGLALHRSGGLPACALVHADPRRLRQLLQLLGTNAVKFTDHGHVTLHASLAADGQALLAIEDTGPGIPPERLAEVFDPFVQGDGSAVRRHGGTGLGLALAHRLTQRMGGQLQCHSSPGQGTRIELRLTLPAAVPRDDGGAASGRSPSSVGVSADFSAGAHAGANAGVSAGTGASPPSTAGAEPALPAPLHGRVLLVEDNAVNAMVANAMLVRAGLRVALATDGEQAVQQLARERFDAVLMDVQMPVLDGLAATRRLREDETRLARARVPVIGLSANVSEDDRQACLAAGMDDFLAKPFREAQLHALLAGHLAAQAPARPVGTPPADRAAPPAPAGGGWPLATPTRAAPARPGSAP